MDRRRLIVLAALVEVTLAAGWFAWRVRAAIAAWSAILGGPGDWITQRVLGLGAQATTAGGLLAAGLIAGGAAAGALILGRPARLERAAWALTAGLVLAAVAIELVCANVPARITGGWILSVLPTSTIVLLSALLAAAAALVVLWSRAAWAELGQPTGPLRDEASRVLFAAAPGLVVLQVVLGDELARLNAVGVTSGTPSAGSITATGAVVLGVAVVRALRREPGAEARDPEVEAKSPE